MSTLKIGALFFGILMQGAQGAEFTPTLRVFPGYVSKVTCEGKLLVSSIGNDSLIRLESLPVALGCAVLLKPLVQAGRTNLILETSSGSIQATLEIRSGTPKSSELEYSLRGERL